MYVGGHLIRRFDGFRRLAAHAAEALGASASLGEEDLMLINRALAALGGPPAAAKVEGAFLGREGLPLLLLFLLTQEHPVRIGLLGDGDDVLGRLKAQAHLLGHGIWPMLTRQADLLEYQQVVARLEDGLIQLHPLLQYDQDGEPSGMEQTGSVSELRRGEGLHPKAGPFTFLVILGAAAGDPVPALEGIAPLHPAQLWLR